MIMRSMFAIVLILTVGACASSSQVLTGTRRVPIAAGDVRVYTQAPRKFEEIAVLGASRNSISMAGGERAIAGMIESMRAQAAQLPVAVGTGVETQTYTHNASIKLGVGGAFGVVKKAAKARAIFVPGKRCEANCE